MAAYQKYPEEMNSEQRRAVTRLEEIRARLLAGTPLVATDLAAIREEMRGAMSRGGPRRGEDAGPNPPGAAAEELGALPRALWALLTTPQKAALLGDVRQAAANNQKAARVAADRALKLIGGLRESDAGAWPATRDRLADCLCSGVGAPESAARANSRRLFQDFLARIRTMSAAEFAQKTEELTSELLALLPPTTNLAVALAEFAPHQIQQAMRDSFLHPRAPDLLREIQAARAAKPPQ